MYTTFTLPKSLGGGDFVMRELTVGQTEDVLRGQGKGPSIGATGDLVMAALVSFRGGPIPKGAEAEEWWRKQPARVGACLSQAYAKLHATTDEEDADFFGSMSASHEPPKVI